MENKNLIENKSVKFLYEIPELAKKDHFLIANNSNK
jgi:hypothetical protein